MSRLGDISNTINQPAPQSMNIETLRLHVGDNFVIRLPGGGTSGYSWILQSSGSEQVLSTTHSTVAPVSTGVLQTGSVDEVFTLHGLSPGNVKLQFELRRSWEKDTPAAQQRLFEVEVLP
jgi:predicted secreted protein